MSFFPANFSEIMAQQLVSAKASTAKTRNYYREHMVPAAEIGLWTGEVHAASILIWCALAERANIPFIPVELVATLSIEAVELLIDNKHHELSPADALALATAEAYADAGGFWRTEFCAGSQVKYTMSEGLDLPAILPFHLDDERIVDMHWAQPNLRLIGRPRLTPVRVNGYPVEFRVFHGGEAQDGAASFYYPQAGEFLITPELHAAMDQAIAWAGILAALRTELGLIPWLPEGGGPAIGSTIDFMLTEERGLVLVDAGPGFGYGAHPCCFIDSPVAGRRWQLAEGVKLR